MLDHHASIAAGGSLAHNETPAGTGSEGRSALLLAGSGEQDWRSGRNPSPTLLRPQSAEWVLTLRNAIKFSPIATVASIGRSRPGFRRSRTVLSVLAVSAASAVLLRMRYLHWGSSAAERAAVLAGDELVPDADQISTRAITINAAPEAVWPWLVQLGQGRGGFYSYTWLENLVPKEDIHNADRICARVAADCRRRPGTPSS